MFGLGGTNSQNSGFKATGLLSHLTNEELMHQIEKKYLEYDLDECLHLIDKRFGGLRTYYQPAPHGSDIGSGRMLHNCMRSSDCECVQLCSYLIAIAFHRNEENVSAFLSGGGFLHEPEIRMPFEPFTEWL
jgi:hypothetical protein